MKIDIASQYYLSYIRFDSSIFIKFQPIQIYKRDTRQYELKYVQYQIDFEPDIKKDCDISFRISFSICDFLSPLAIASLSIGNTCMICMNEKRNSRTSISFSDLKFVIFDPFLSKTLFHCRSYFAKEHAI